MPLDFDKVVDDWIQTQPDARKASRVGKLIKSAQGKESLELKNADVKDLPEVFWGPAVSEKADSIELKIYRFAKLAEKIRLTRGVSHCRKSDRVSACMDRRTFNSESPAR